MNKLRFLLALGAFFVLVAALSACGDDNVPGNAVAKVGDTSITKEQFNRSNYFQKKYGKLEYVSESGRLFKTNKGKVLKFNESHEITK
jgi:hypothetical protein